MAYYALKLPLEWSALFPAAEVHAERCRESLEEELAHWEGRTMRLVVICALPFDYAKEEKQTLFSEFPLQTMREHGIFLMGLFPFTIPLRYYETDVRRTWTCDVHVHERLLRIAAFCHSETFLLPLNQALEMLLPIECFAAVPSAGGSLADQLHLFADNVNYIETFDKPFPTEQTEILSKEKALATFKSGKTVEERVAMILEVVNRIR